MYPHMYDAGSGWWLVMMLGMMLFLVAVFVGLFLLYRALTPRGTVLPATGPSPTETPRAILDRRLAAGEISPADYDAVRRKLEGDESPG